MSNRPETGPMQFKDDWSGVFIRGDNAFGYAMALKRVLDGEKGIPEVYVRGLLALLEGSNEMHEGSQPQLLKPWKECQR